ncbi:hypothetical protein [Nocardioides sp. SYSU DS0651]|uniref:hypothetical protein n=1 Tax=Nocardioides sp. SYSU DS0651 TaxID=3415955 RepID=UPI003F4B9095
MSVTRTHPPELSGGRTAGPRPRVREQARDAVVLMAFSAAVSLGCALLLLVSTGAGR